MPQLESVGRAARSGVSLGGGAIVEEAGSVVLEGVPPWVFCYGTPARSVGQLEEPQ
ncbi:hypothetical protein KAU37_02955 [Candidatus Bipolaricaulota bacterium]|nr:hypothetical protein [Candidatus Bipolaricaulota bacterium]